MNLPDAPIANEGFFVTHFFTVSDQEKSKDFYVRILGGKVIKPENPCYIKPANTWIILNSGGGPTPDKPEVLLETPSNLNRVNSFLNLRVADIWACYKQWSDRGAFFLTEPLDNHGWELRCYLRDPAATSSRLANILKWRSTISTNTRVEKITNSFTSSVWADTGLTCRILQPNAHRPAVRFRRRQGVPMSLLVKARLIIIVLAATTASLAGAEDLRAPDTFSSLSNPSERARALFVEAGRVLQHPRCLNCHPVGERPTQGDDRHPHSPLVLRDSDDKGAVGMRCTTCHQSANYAPSGVPGHPQWHVAPKSMAWQTKSLGQICEQIKDQRRNGGKTLAAIHEHMAHDSLVGWAWMPGGNREPAPGTQAQLGALIAAWIEAGAACPAS